MMDDKPQIELHGFDDSDNWKVVSLDTGEEVDRPDVVGTARAQFGEAFERAGGKIRVVRDDDNG